jgi:outer membrane protein assembly factor BamB
MENLTGKNLLVKTSRMTGGLIIIFPSPVINGDTLVIASADGKVLALNKQNGKSYWEF